MRVDDAFRAFRREVDRIATARIIGGE